ncbi:ATPase [Pedobacter sp. HMF7647]|uniref:ATPase n=1 Tax=Hufsiella arboris TaxID=2695275 RepID=A0A7K1YBS8_9SPHI|nr:SRPBCC domain-containing protein [Hufsiella arboris]MXV52054.1 ATPase [Hufsiella arboris]
MSDKTLEASAKIQISKSPAEVFEAIVNPDKMSNYFIADSNGRLEESKELIWHFPEFKDDCPVRSSKITKNEFVSFYWGPDEDETLVEISLTEKNGGTVVSVAEKSKENNEAGIKWLRGNTEGWANFLACMKAYLEYGINLRKGAFDFMK